MKTEFLIFVKNLSLVMAVFSLFLAGASAEVERGKGDFRDGKVAVDLVSEVKSIRAGEAFTVGLRLIHASGWHTYWKSPGVAGVPTTLQWEMPVGFTADPFRWPAPQRSTMAGMTVFGYEGERLLPMTIHPPAHLKPDKNGRVQLRVRAAWMACAVSCHPGWQDFVLDLPVTDGEPEIDGEWAAAFQQARDSVPLPAPEAWSFEVERKEGEIKLLITPGEKMSKTESAQRFASAYFFAEQDQLESSAAQVLEFFPGGRFSITMKMSKYAPEDTQQLQGVLAFDRALVKVAGKQRRWMQVFVPWGK